MQMQVSIQIPIHTHIYTKKHILTYIYVYIYLYTYICRHVSIHIYIYIYIHLYIHMHIVHGRFRPTRAATPRPAGRGGQLLGGAAPDHPAATLGWEISTPGGGSGLRPP